MVFRVLVDFLMMVVGVSSSDSSFFSANMGGKFNFSERFLVLLIYMDCLC